MKSKYFNLLFVLLVLGLMHCGDTNIEGLDADVDPATLSITITQLEDDAVTAKVPLGIYGTEVSDLEDASVSIYINGVLVVEGLLVTDLYHPLSVEVLFSLSPVEDNDALGFLVVQNDGGELYYEGVVSDASETTASISILD